MAKLVCNIVFDNRRMEEVNELKDDLEILLHDYPAIKYDMEVISVKGRMLESKSISADIIDVEIMSERIEPEVTNFPIVLSKGE